MKTNSRFTKIAVASGLIVASGAAVLGITGFASAELAQNKAQTQVVAPAEDSGTTGNAAADGNAAAGGNVAAQAIDGQAPEAMGPGHDGGPRFVTDGLAKVLGLSTTDLQTQLQTKSLADIAKAQNVDIADVKAQLLKDYTEKEQAEVESGKHTQAEVDAKIAAFKANLDTMVNNVRPARGPGMGGKGAAVASDAVAKVLGLSTTELQTQLQTKSLADIAKAQNVDIDKVKDVIVSAFKAHLDEEVAAGDHTQAEADAKLAGFKANLDTMVNSVRPAGPMGMGGQGMGGHRGGHGHDHGDGPMGMDGQGGPLGGPDGGAPTQGAGFSA